MIKRLIAGKEPTERSLFIWNLIGSAVYALASMILTYMTIRVAGEEQGGVFAIALTLGQMFIYIAYYEMRNYQVTDAQNKYQFSQYHAVKIVNCMLMMLAVVLYAVFQKYDLYKAEIIILVCFYRMLDGYADVYEAEFHKQGRLDLAGKSMTFRTILSVGIYFIILIVTKNLRWAVWGAIISGILGILIFNFWIFDSVGTIQTKWDKESFKGILKDCFPLFVGMFLWTYLLSASRLAVDQVMPSEYQSYYQTLFMPVSVINLFAGFLIRPSLIQLTELYSKRSMKEFWKIIGRMLALLAGFTVICMIGAYICGIPVLSLLVNCQLEEYRTMFVFLILAGGVNAVAYLLYYVLTIFRDQSGIMIGYGIASVVALLISARMTRQYELWGASASYFISITVLAVLFVLRIGMQSYKEKNNK